MPTTTAAQDQVLESIRKSQEATVNAYRSWAQTFTTVLPKVVDVVPVPNADEFFGFAEKLWGYQRDFATSLLEVASDFGKAAPDGARRAADTVRNTPKP